MTKTCRMFDQLALTLWAKNNNLGGFDGLKLQVKPVRGRVPVPLAQATSIKASVSSREIILKRFG